MAFHIPDSWRRYFVVALVISLFCGPAGAYVVLLKDGTQLITREKFRRDGDRVLLVLPNGTETFIDAAEVDFEKTEELNTVNLGQSRVIEQNMVFVEEEEPAEDETFRSIAQRTRLTLPEIRQREDSSKLEEGAIPHTLAGFVDLWRLQRTPHTDTELTNDLENYLKGQGAEGYKIFMGTTERSILLEMATNTETAVLQNIRYAADALIQTQTRFPDKIESLELVMSTSKNQRAGQFVLTRSLADKLVSGAIDPPTFFYRHVQF